jgi:micrococcal nuclease
MAKLKKAIVMHVVDGDTVDVRYLNNRKARVRLIGVNTPESRASFHKKKEPFGEEAKQFTIDNLTGKTVYIETDVSKADMYDRILAYVWLDRDTMYNKILVEEGLARVYTWKPDVKYRHIFEDAETEAFEAKKGLWSIDFFERDTHEHKNN